MNILRISQTQQNFSLCNNTKRNKNVVVFDALYITMCVKHFGMANIKKIKIN